MSTKTASAKMFLGKQGRISGPFTPEQIQEMRMSGKIQEFTFLWDAELEEWRPLEMPPPRPDGVKPRTSGRKRSIAETVEALCYDRLSLVAGRIENVMEEGCELVAGDATDTPALSVRSQLTLNLLNPKSGESLSVRVRLADALRRDSSWVYRLTWDGVPSFSGD